MKCAILSFVILFLFSCKEKKPTVDISESKAIKPTDSVKFNRDSSINALLALFNEPPLQKSAHAVFRFIHAFPFPHQPTWIFRIEEERESVFTMTTKLVSVSEEDSGQVLYKGELVRFKKAIVLDSVKQVIGTNDWQDLIHIIEGTYYWAFEDPCPNGDGYTDGTTLMMESVSICCSEPKLMYHFNSIHVPKGGFEEALTLLKKMTNLKVEK